MNSVVMCSFASICTTIVHDGSVKINELEMKLSSLQSTVLNDKESLHYFINNTELLIDSKLEARRSEDITKPIVETLDKIKHQMQEVTKDDNKALHCYEIAKQNATIVGVHAFHAINPCVEEYLKLKPVIRNNITHYIELLHMTYHWTTLTMTSPCKKDFDECIKDRVFMFEVAYTEMYNKIESAQVIAFEAQYDASEKLEKCIDKFKTGFNANLQKIQSDATACISAS